MTGHCDQLSLDGTVKPAMPPESSGAATGQTSNTTPTEFHPERCLLYSSKLNPTLDPRGGLIVTEGALNGAAAHSVSPRKALVLAAKNHDTFTSRRFRGALENLLKIWQKPTKVTVITDSTTEGLKAAEKLTETLAADAESVTILIPKPQNVEFVEAHKQTDRNPEGLLTEHNPGTVTAWPDSEQGWLNRETEMRHEYEKLLAAETQQTSRTQQWRILGRLNELAIELGLYDDPLLERQLAPPRADTHTTTSESVNIHNDQTSNK